MSYFIKKKLTFQPCVQQKKHSESKLNLHLIRDKKQYSPCPWSPLERFPMFSGLFILPLDKQSIVIQILS